MRKNSFFNRLKGIIASAAAVVMAVGTIGAVPVAASDYKITVTNTNTTSQSIAGKTYSAYKLFDASYSENNVSYTIKTDNAFYTDTTSGTAPDNGGSKGVLDNFFTFADTTDATVKNVSVKTTGTFAESHATYFADGNLTDAGARALADALQPHLTDKTAITGTVEAGNETVTIDVGEPGYYLVTGGSGAKQAGETNNDIISAVILTNATPTASVNPKLDAPQLTKKMTSVKEGSTTVSGAILDADGKAAVAKVGSTVSYELTSKVPNTTGYTEYTYTIHDSLTNGLDYVATAEDTSNVVVKIGDNTLTNVASGDTNASTAGYCVVTVDTSARTLTITIPKASLEKTASGADIVDGTAITVTYDATVNQTSVTHDYENNTAYLEYSNNPYDTDEKNTTPKQETYVININVNVTKYDDATLTSGDDYDRLQTYLETNSDATTYNDTTSGNHYVKIGSNWHQLLQGASFQLYRDATDAEKESDPSTNKYYYKWDTTNNVVTWVKASETPDTFTTNANGKFDTDIRGLDKGTYYLTETAHPTGYNLLSGDIQITISVSESDNKVTYTVNTDSTYPNTLTNDVVDISQAQNSNQPLDTVQVANKSGSSLPGTGGIGTTMFYVFGAAVVAAAVALLIAKKRKNA